MSAKNLLLAICIAAMPLPVSAQTPPAPPPPVMDSVTLDLSAEDWVQTATAKIIVQIDAAVPGSDAGKVRADMMKAVNGLVSGAQWRFSAFDRSQDQSGLERSHAELETRLKEAELAGLADKAKNESRPGLQLRLSEVDFTPTLAETEAVKASLRNQIYGQVNEEMKRLNTAEPDRKFRIAGIDFTAPEAAPTPRPMMHMQAMAAPAAPAMEEPVQPVTVQQKLQLEAHVVLAAIAPKE